MQLRRGCHPGRRILRVLRLWRRGRSGLHVECRGIRGGAVRCHNVPVLREHGQRNRQTQCSLRQQRGGLEHPGSCRHLQQRIEHVLECLWFGRSLCGPLPRNGRRFLRNHRFDRTRI